MSNLTFIIHQSPHIFSTTILYSGKQRGISGKKHRGKTLERNAMTSIKRHRVLFGVEFSGNDMCDHERESSSNRYFRKD